MWTGIGCCGVRGTNPEAHRPAQTSRRLTRGDHHGNHRAETSENIAPGRPHRPPAPPVLRGSHRTKSQSQSQKRLCTRHELAVPSKTFSPKALNIDTAPRAPQSPGAFEPAYIEHGKMVRFGGVPMPEETVEDPTLQHNFKGHKGVVHACAFKPNLKQVWLSPAPSPSPS